MKPVVAIVGRPNAGKSTLFNRLTRTRDALVDSTEGVTRDRHYGSASFNDVDFTVIDTGGFYHSDSDQFVQKTHDQIRYAIEDADAIIALFDGAMGISPHDQDIVDLLRASAKPVLFAVNKMDHLQREESLADFYAFGIETVFPISAEHGHGIYELLEALVKTIPKTDAEESEEPIRLAIIGRPNVGKSSLVNRILGEERVIVSDIPGTTRDAIDTRVEVDGRAYLLIDTAGIRKKARVSEKLEKFAVVKAMDAIARCDVALILIDAADGIVEQDIKIAGYAYEKGRACIFLLNKWDLIEKSEDAFKKFKEDLQYQASYMSYAPFLTISALTGRRVPKIFEAIEAVHEQFSMRCATGPLNRIITDATDQNEPSLFRGRRLKFFYATQIASKPPTFVCFVNYPEGVHFSYQRYLVNRLRESLGLDKVPIRLFLRKRSGDSARPRRQSRSNKKPLRKRAKRQGKRGGR